MPKQRNPSGEIAELAFASSFKKKTPIADRSAPGDGIQDLILRFEDASHLDEDGVDFWNARELSSLLGYTDYRNFLSILSKAKEACLGSQQPIDNHFVDVTEMVEIGSNAETFGYKGLYGGLDKAGIQRRKGLKSKENPLDHMGSTELAANLFRATQTEDKLKRERTQGKVRANDLHYAVGKKVRDAIRELGGTMPEALPAAENIEKVSKRLKSTAARSLRPSVSNHSEE